MKKILLATILSILLVPAAAFAAIEGSVHDINGKGCAGCHTPHGGSEAANGPLWDQTVPVGATYTLYGNDSIDANDISDPTGISLLCMGCHDGVTAIEAMATPTAMTGSSVIGNDLSNDHPIEFTFGTALQLADGALNDPTSPTIADMLQGAANDQMTCATCHDVHGEGAGSPLLRIDNANSALCITCHIK